MGVGRPRGLAGAGAGSQVAIPALLTMLPCAVEANEDYEDYEYDELPARDDPGVPLQPVTPLQLFEGRRNRRRREAPKVVEEQESRVHYTVCIWWAPGAALGQGREGRTQAGAGLLEPAQAEPGGQVTSLHRRNGKVGLSGMAIADITLLSGFHALRADLEKVWSDPRATPSAPVLSPVMCRACDL